MLFNEVANIVQYDLVNSRTCGTKFKDFQAPILYSSTFKALNLGEENSSTFKDAWEPLDFNEARDDGMAVASAGPYANHMRLASDR